MKFESTLRFNIDAPVDDRFGSPAFDLTLAYSWPYTRSAMVPKPSLVSREAHIPKPVPIGGDTMSVIVSLAATSILSIFLCASLLLCMLHFGLGTNPHAEIVQRITAVRSWSRLPFVAWRECLWNRSWGTVINEQLSQQSFLLSISILMASSSPQRFFNKSLVSTPASTSAMELFFYASSAM